MKDEDKTKEQLINELVEFRKRIAELKKSRTDLKQAERAVQEAREYAESIVETVREPLLVLDVNLKIISANRSFYQTFKVTPEKTKGQLLYDLGDRHWNIPKLRQLLEEILPKNTIFEDFEVEHEFPTIGRRIMLLNARRMYRETNQMELILLAIEDITERKQVEEEIKRLYEKAKVQAERDPLTDLFNHRRINELLESEIERAKRGADIFSIMMLDVDGFKLINDTYGHVAGDKVLKDVAAILRNSSRSVDSIGRYGGDEFLMILPYTDGEKAKTVVKRISRDIPTEGLKINEEVTVPIRLSVGVATYPIDSSLPRDLISLADRSMYESKRSGRSAVSASMREVSDFLSEEMPTFDVLHSLVAAVDNKDHYTKSHSDLVTNYALSLGKKINLSSEELEALEVASLLHDIGKIGIPDTILIKPGPLEKGELEIIKQHPTIGAMMLRSSLPHRQHLLEAIRYHHERYDGRGYPSKLEGEDIPVLARIIGIADAYCAMITDRPYRKALTKDEAIAELTEKAGTQFDPVLVSGFIKCLEEG